MVYENTVADTDSKIHFLGNINSLYTKTYKRFYFRVVQPYFLLIFLIKINDLNTNYFNHLKF